MLGASTCLQSEFSSLLQSPDSLAPRRRSLIVKPASSTRRAELDLLYSGVLGLMGSHAPAAPRVLLALAAVLLLAAVSDGIRPAPAGNTKLERAGMTSTEMIIPASQLAAFWQGSGGDRDQDQDLLLREEVRATGSSLPDCSHACGACSPCSRVMVSFKCSTAEPLPCPMVYRCMCRGKCYPVPSS